MYKNSHFYINQLQQVRFLYSLYKFYDTSIKLNKQYKENSKKNDKVSLYNERKIIANNSFDYNFVLKTIPSS